jgi:hypothetical protein
MVAKRILVLHFSPNQIRVKPNEVVSVIRTALNSAKGRSLPDITALPGA